MCSHIPKPVSHNPIHAKHHCFVPVHFQVRLPAKAFHSTPFQHNTIKAPLTHDSLRSYHPVPLHLPNALKA